jgi:hypothetical protein
MKWHQLTILSESGTLTPYSLNYTKIQSGTKNSYQSTSADWPLRQAKNICG